MCTARPPRRFRTRWSLRHERLRKGATCPHALLTATSVCYQGVVRQQSTKQNNSGCVRGRVRGCGSQWAGSLHRRASPARTKQRSPHWKAGLQLHPPSPRELLRANEQALWPEVRRTRPHCGVAHSFLQHMHMHVARSSASGALAVVTWRSKRGVKATIWQRRHQKQTAEASSQQKRVPGTAWQPVFGW